jgi:ATP-binding cassette subfamily C protein CydC
VEIPIQALPCPDSADLQVRNLSFRYPIENQGQHVRQLNLGADLDPFQLQDLSFDLPTGKRLAIVGPSGSGKTTLIHLLLRYWPYQQGEVRLGGIELRQCHPDAVRCQFSLVSQKAHLFNATILDNLLVGNPVATQAEVMSATQRVQLHEFIESLPGGYQTPIGELGTRLSGGERQRLCIARALLKTAPILILDEPTANLDAIHRRTLIDLVTRQLMGRSLILLTHHLIGLERMDEILVMRAGEIVERGSHAVLLARDGLYARMLEIQARTLREVEA